MSSLTMSQLLQTTAPLLELQNNNMNMVGAEIEVKEVDPNPGPHNKPLQFSVKLVVAHVRRTIFSSDEEERVVDLDDPAPVESTSPLPYDPSNDFQKEYIRYTLRCCLGVDADLTEQVLRRLKSYTRQLISDSNAGLVGEGEGEGNPDQRTSLVVTIKRVVSVEHGVLVKDKGTRVREVIKGLKRVRAEDLHVDEGDECAVCLQDLADHHTEVTYLPCNHAFHDGCIAKWLTKSPSCPVCRFQLGGPAKKPRLLADNT